MFSFFKNPRNSLKSAANNLKNNARYLFKPMAVAMSSLLATGAQAGSCFTVDGNPYEIDVNDNPVYGDTSNLMQALSSQCGVQQEDSCPVKYSASMHSLCDLPYRISSWIGHSAYDLPTCTLYYYEGKGINDCVRQTLQDNCPSGFGGNWGDYPITAGIVLVGMGLLCCGGVIYCVSRPVAASVERDAAVAERKEDEPVVVSDADISIPVLDESVEGVQNNTANDVVVVPGGMPVEGAPQLSSVHFICQRSSLGDEQPGLPEVVLSAPLLGNR